MKPRGYSGGGYLRVSELIKWWVRMTELHYAQNGKKQKSGRSMDGPGISTLSWTQDCYETIQKDNMYAVPRMGENFAVIRVYGTRNRLDLSTYEKILYRTWEWKKRKSTQKCKKNPRSGMIVYSIGGWGGQAFLMKSTFFYPYGVPFSVVHET